MQLRKDCIRLAWTMVFRRVPPPSPAPRDLALSTYLMPNSARSAAMALPNFGSHAVQTDLVRDTCMASSSIIRQTRRRKPTSISCTASRLATISAERSSTYNVGITCTYSILAASTMWIMTSLISVVALPDPAVIPQTASSVFE